MQLLQDHNYLDVNQCVSNCQILIPWSSDVNPIGPTEGQKIEGYCILPIILGDYP